VQGEVTAGRLNRIVPASYFIKNNRIVEDGIDIKEIKWEDVDLIHLLRIGTRGGLL
jgi:hypothetical protein